MSIKRIWAVLLQEGFITKWSLEVMMDLPFFSVMNTVVFGFLSLFLVGSNNGVAAYYLFLGMLLWEIIRITQYSMSVGSLWNIWSRNLTNMFIAPLSLTEYFIAQMLSGVIKTLIIFLLISTIALWLFHFNIFSLGILNLGLFFINLTFFAWSTGVAILGLIFRYGTRIQSLAWGLIFLFQPITAAYFPVDILPKTLQTLAYLLPPTYVFEAARGALENPAVNWQLMGWGLFENLIYFAAAIIFFNYMFNKSKETGQFARNEG